jgi:sialidase-1
MTALHRRDFLALTGAALLARPGFGAPAAAFSGVKQTEVFAGGQDGYYSYRIPSLLVTPKGTLLAFCEGRRKSRSDTGDIDLVMKKSTDHGTTWGPVRVIAEDGANTLGNPCPVLDRDSGTIWMPLTHNLGHESQKQIVERTAKGTRTVWLMKSTDDGETWSKPVEITKTTKDPNWTWYATGPGCGIQLRSGRMVIPCDHYVAGSGARRSHVIYSDDRGATWKLGGVLGEMTNECQVVELQDGSLLMNMRSYHKKNRRAIATSKDGGLTWSDVTLDDALVEPVCQASFLRFTTADRHQKNRLLFANPASTKREKMTVRVSYDEGKTWPVAKLLNAGPSGYSALAVLPDLTVGCLYERGEKQYSDRITLARCTLDWLSDGADRV